MGKEPRLKDNIKVDYNHTFNLTTQYVDSQCSFVIDNRS